jgi:Ser/Thr protein kinase RdoA (MazF antagonist)
MRELAGVPAAPDLSRRLERQWGWIDARIRRRIRGLNDVCRIEAGGQVGWLKIYRHGSRRRRQIQAEIELLLRLRRRQLAVVEPIAKRDGSFIERLEGSGGRRYAVLFSDAPGRAPGTDSGSCFEYGRLAAAIHHLTDGYAPRARAVEFNLHHLTRQPLSDLAPLLRRLPGARDYLAGAARDLGAALWSLLPVAAPEFGLCHGDLTFANVHRDRNGRLTLFDFDCFGQGFRAYDIAVFLWSRGTDLGPRARASRARQWNRFLEGYQSVRALSEAELRAAVLFVPLRHLWLLGVHARLKAEFGRRWWRRYTWLTEARLRAHVAFIREWLARYGPV